MYGYEEGFYNEPSEFEEMMDDMKVKLKEAVKEEHIAELERYKKENAELQEVKKNFEAIKREYKEKERQLEREKSDMKREVRKERLSELMSDMKTVMYHADINYIKKPKCDKCDQDRKIEYKTPRGRKAYEDCECREREREYAPKEHIVVEFRLDAYGKNKMVVFYKLKESMRKEEDYGEYAISNSPENIYDGTQKFDDLQRHSTFFKNKEECQMYCDYLNAKQTCLPSNLTGKYPVKG